MAKIEVGAKNFLYPMPVTLVGAHVSGKPNFITIAHVGILHYTTVSLSMNKRHYTNAGIKENKVFSVNLPSTRMVQETDYCGMVSGSEVDKGALFNIFYGRLPAAPMIRECPANMECRLIQTVDLPTHDVFIGEIVATYCEESCLTRGKNVDLAQLDPILYSMSGARYFRLGEQFARAWDAGKTLAPGDVPLRSAPPAAQE